MLPRYVFHLRYAALMLVLVSLAANRQDERESGRHRQSGRNRHTPSAVVPVLGIRG